MSNTEGTYTFHPSTRAFATGSSPRRPLIGRPRTTSAHSNVRAANYQQTLLCSKAAHLLVLWVAAREYTSRWSQQVSLRSSTVQCVLNLPPSLACSLSLQPSLACSDSYHTSSTPSSVPLISGCAYHTLQRIHVKAETSSRPTRVQSDMDIGCARLSTNLPSIITLLPSRQTDRESSTYLLKSCPLQQPYTFIWNFVGFVLYTSMVQLYELYGFGCVAFFSKTPSILASAPSETFYEVIYIVCVSIQWKVSGCFGTNNICVDHPPLSVCPPNPG